MGARLDNVDNIRRSRVDVVQQATDGSKRPATDLDVTHVDAANSLAFARVFG
jgi:hypothetical protein